VSFAIAVKQMVNLLDSTSGTIHFFGKEIKKAGSLIAENVGYMPQSSATLNQLTVSEALMFTAKLRGLSRSQSLQELERLLALWQIEDLARKFCARLSGGEKRLLQIAVAMSGSPPVLVLDEPTNELSPQRRKHVWDVLRSLNAEKKTTIIFITHDAIEAEKAVQRIGILNKGRLIAVGSPTDLKKQIDRRIRLELIYTSNDLLSLPAEMVAHEIGNGRWLVYLERNQLEQVLDILKSSQAFDFRVYSATLEDLYMHYAKQ
jgi:ABC-type multidrug transport system ATPase subunit